MLLVFHPNNHSQPQTPYTFSLLSCGELSAGSESKEEDESFYTKRKSQLNVIFSVLGTPDESELSHLDDKTARDIRALKRIPLSVRLQHVRYAIPAHVTPFSAALYSTATHRNP